MLKIHQLFLRSFILIFLGILSGVVIVSYFWLKSTYIKETQRELQRNIELFVAIQSDLNNIDEQIMLIKKRTNLRVTIIDENGVVIAESDKDKANMDNHINREEILNINSNGFGQSIRESESVNKSMLNVVKKVIIDNKVVYVRMGDYLTSLENKFLNLTLQISAIFAIFLLISLLLIYILSKKLQEQTNKIIWTLSKLAQKNGVSKSNLRLLDFKYTYEFYKIAAYLKKVALRLSKKEKQKEKYTANLKLANTQKDEIISAISHEFKNPISIISGYCQTLLEDKSLRKDMQKTFLLKIYNSANKMTNLIDRLRLSLKLEQDKYEQLLTKTNLNNLCLDIIESLKQKYKNRNIVFTSKEVVKSVDETLFSQAIENLIENALKYSQDEININLNEDELSIKDKGIGIKKDELEKIDKKFYRVSQNSWNNSLGLGLFIVQKILKLHNFKLHIQSDYEEGSTFTIIFKET